MTAFQNALSFHDQVRRARPFGVIVMFLVWTLIGFLSYGRYYFQAMQTGPVPALWHVFPWLACFYPWVILAPLIFSLEARSPLTWSAHGLNNFFILAAFGIPLAFIAFETRIFLAIGFEYFLRVPAEPLIPPWQICPVEFLYHHIPYWVSIGGSYVLRHLAKLPEREREAARLALEKSELESTLRLAQLEALRMKLNPHFLFNTLQNISVLALQDPNSAILMLTRLGDLLRASFRKDSQQVIPLEAEIALTQAYLDIERVRFRDRLSVLVDIAPGTESALVPTFLLQPLVENAIKHGLTCRHHSGHIHIRSEIHAKRLILTVADNGAGIPAHGIHDLPLGVGLGSTFERLNRLYPDQHEFTVRNIREGGTEVRIALPLHTNNAGFEAAHVQPATFPC